MYLLKQHEESDLSVLHALIRSHPLGTWIVQDAGEIVVNHVPFLLDPSVGGHGTLRAHVARANKVWQCLSPTVESVVVFQGPDAYVSPSRYPSPQGPGWTLPTWIYTVVHAHGMPVVIQEPAWLLDHVTRLTATHETGQAHPWLPADAPGDFIAQKISQIVGIEIPISRIVGKWKTSRTRARVDQPPAEPLGGSAQTDSQ